MDKSFIKPNRMMMRAFKEVMSEMVGDIDIELEIGPHVFNVPFHIMNIKPAYSMLLGKLWVHSVGAIASFLD